ncbi:unnamed protein product [Camellia sinensis]
MDKAAKWFRGLFGLKKDHSPSQSAAKPPKRRWSFVKSHRERDGTATKNTTTDDAVDPSKHAITAAEKITSSGRSNATTATSAAYVSEWAVITIQAHFRGHQARRALRALKGLVKLQALVRGHIVRKRTVELAQILQAMYRAQARACARRAQISESPHSSNKSSQFQARRELRASKGLVKLQALVRGHIVRKLTVDVVQRLQAWLQAQARACAGRTQISESPHSSNKSSQFQARRELRALKGLVKLQALVRGHIVRKRTVELAQILQAMYRAQARACARRAQISESLHSSNKSSQFQARRELYRAQARACARQAQISESPHSSNKSSQFQARRELRALKGLVKLQALVRGHIVRKLTVDVVQRLQAWLRAQAHGCAGILFTGPATPVKFERAISSKIAKHDQSPMLLNGPQFYSASSRSGSPKRGPFTPSKSDGSRSNLSCHYPNCMACTESSRAKVRSLSAPKQRPQFESSVSSKRYSVHGYGESRSSSLRVSANFANKAYLGSGRLERLGMPVRGEVHSLCPLKSMQGNTEESPFCTANNGPQFYSASSRSGSPKRGPFTPSKSDGSRSNLSCHYPNCMACTESSRPKVRSLSAPKRRPQFESSVSSKRYSVHGYGESRSSSLRVSTNFANKAYLGSSRLERLGMPLRGEVHSLCPLMSMQGNTEESPFCTANNGPQFYSASSRSGSPKRGPFTPSKSDGSRSNLSCHYPNCMACTESSRPKVRSLSAPNKGPNLRALFHPKGTQFMGMVSPDQSLSGIWSFGEAWNACDRRCNLAQCWPLEQILE